MRGGLVVDRIITFTRERVRNAVYEQPFMGEGEFLGFLVRDLREDDGGQ